MARQRAVASAGTGRRVKQIILWCGAICLITAAVNVNVSQLQARSTDIMSKVNQKAIASTGHVLTASGSTVSTAVAKQGAAQCSSNHASDTPTAQCQSFCNEKFKKFHCLWCKCRACTFCPKGDDAIAQAAIEESPPPPSAPPPIKASQSLLLGGTPTTSVRWTGDTDTGLAQSSSVQDIASESSPISEYVAGGSSGSLSTSTDQSVAVGEAETPEELAANQALDEAVPSPTGVRASEILVQKALKDKAIPSTTGPNAPNASDSSPIASADVTRSRASGNSTSPAQTGAGGGDSALDSPVEGVEVASYGEGAIDEGVEESYADDVPDKMAVAAVNMRESAIVGISDGTASVVTSALPDLDQNSPSTTDYTRLTARHEGGESVSAASSIANDLSKGPTLKEASAALSVD